MSDTPRTDEFIETVVLAAAGGACSWGDIELVADFARVLEREISELKAEAEE